MKKAVAALFMSMVVSGSLMETAIGVLHTVGDSAGWTTIGNVDYKQWAATKTFNLGDTIVFAYNKQFHNVMQVTHADYRSCKVSAPISTHSTGNDSITITNYGHHFYLCAVPGHCQAGQKVDINVQRVSSTLAPTPSASDPLPSPSMSSPSLPPTSATVDTPNSVGKAAFATLSHSKLGMAIVVFVVSCIMI